MSIAQCIAQELAVSTQQVNTAIDLLDEGATVPFIARYRKEKTNNLDDNQLRLLETRLQYLRELQKRKETIIKSIREQGKLSKTLEHLIHKADTRTALEDIYLPWDQSIEILNKLALKHHVKLVSIGNGTAARETDQLVVDLIQRYPKLNLAKLMTSEAGASVYSASELAAKEFPDLDVSLRGAVSIARRLQDPLAELVKIEPKAIGVGQYQHDVNQTKLSHSLDATVEDCVNAVGVDVNTASAALLSHIAGLNRGLAENIVVHRNEHGVFPNRNALKKVKRLGPKAFEQAAGFLRITNGDNPLDTSAVHPEAYSVVTALAQQIQKSIPALIGQSALLKQLQPSDYVNAQFGLPTIKDIFAELEKPGRDPRPEFITAQFKEGINHLKDLYEGLMLEGVVSNVTNFGAFVDIGVHQDGLVHISQLDNRFVKDPRDIVKVGEVVTVRVTAVDIQRKRIALSMKTAAKIDKVATKSDTHKTQKKSLQSVNNTHNAINSAMADAFRKIR